MTKYRITSNGYWHYLQYEITYKILWFWTTTRWEYVPKPFCNMTTGTNLYSDDDVFINTLSGDNLEKFIKQWPDIEPCLKITEKNQELLEVEYEKRREEIRKKKEEIIYVN